ncbi:hemagglutinin repeat-containing protein, partial [Neisseria shayeganii]
MPSGQAGQGYQAAQSIRGQAAGRNNTGSGINVSITYGEQRNSQERHSSGHTAQGAQILGRGQVSLSARGAGQASDIRISGAEIAGQSGTRLEAEGDIRLQAARQTHRETGRSRQAGWKAGVALDFSNGVSVGVTGGGNYGKGRSESEAVRHLHSRIGSAGSRTALTSGGDTTLQGARVLGQGIALDARNLHIESLQDSARHNSSQYHGQGQITVGYGFSADGSYQQSQLNAEHQSVAEQSGLYAGDDGFQVSVNGHTRLNGGLIVSGEAAESAGRNRFVSGSLSSSD